MSISFLYHKFVFLSSALKEINFLKGYLFFFLRNKIEKIVVYIHGPWIIEVTRHLIVTWCNMTFIYV